VPPVPQQGRGNARQRQRVIDDIRRAVARDAPQFGERARKWMRIDRLALDQSTIAK
jgi:hypothetical protein